VTDQQNNFPAPNNPEPPGSAAEKRVHESIDLECVPIQQRPEFCYRCHYNIPSAEHSEGCTSNEAVMGRVDLESSRLDKMAKAAEYRMRYGNPLDRMKRLVDAGEATAEREEVNGGMFYRFTSTHHPEVTTRYGPVPPEELSPPLTDAELWEAWDMHSRLPELPAPTRIPVTGLKSTPTRKWKRRPAMLRFVGRRLRDLGTLLAGE
jgi:hypothetical protein